MSKQKKQLIRIIVGAVLLAIALGLDVSGMFASLAQIICQQAPSLETRFGAENMETIICIVFYLLPYVIAAWNILLEAVRNIGRGQVFDETFLMCTASVAAFAIGEYEEAVAVVLFFQVGELFEHYAVNRSRQSISALMDICPEYANIEVDGTIQQVDPDEVSVGDEIIILPGERVPLDGKVVEGESMVDTSALTGESVPRAVRQGDEIISGCVNGNQPLKVRVSKEFEDSTVSKILELVENASARKAPVENFITKFARYYTPTVVVLALLLAVVPPLLGMGGFSMWIHRACTFLVISCPCALVISVPMGFFGGIGAASSQGILVKGSNYLEALARVDTIVFDKTGTLTSGCFKVTGVTPSKWFAGRAAEKSGADRINNQTVETGQAASQSATQELLELAACAESRSTHPIAKSVMDAYEEGQKGGSEKPTRIASYEEIPGHGICCCCEDGSQIAVGNEKLMERVLLAEELEVFHRERLQEGLEEQMSTCVYVALDGMYAGKVMIADVIKEHTESALRSLKKAGVSKTVMLTGDRKGVGEAVAKLLHIDEVYTQLLPGDKVSMVEKLARETEAKNTKLAFVGDGINDAPVIARADVGIAMGSMGSDAAIEAADIVLMDDDIGKISVAFGIARKTLKIVKQNIVFALAVKLLVLILGAIGAVGMWAAVFADVGVSVLAILNSMRALKVDKKESAHP